MESKLTSGTLPADRKITLDSVPDAIAAIGRGEVIIVVDDEDRENEGDFICAAELVTPEIINFMATEGRGLICTPIDEYRADELNLPMMVHENTALHETAFTVSIDLIGQGCSTGISAYDRATGIRAMIDPKIEAKDFARPGHIFPLRAKTGGVLRRTGHTEAAVDLAKLAGYSPAGVLVEILNPDGTMARLPQLSDIAKKHDLKIISIKDLVEYRLRHEKLIQKELSNVLQTEFGEITVSAYKQLTTGDIHLAMCLGDLSGGDSTAVRVHSATGSQEILGVMFGDYSRRLKDALSIIADQGSGVLLYMRHGDKESDLLENLRKLSTDEGPLLQGAKRDFGIGAQILVDLGLQRIRLITDHPKRLVALEAYDLEIVGTIALSGE